MAEIRSPRPDEEAAVLALVNAHGQAMWGEDLASADEVHQWFTFPREVLLAAVEADGRFSAFAAVIDPSDDHAIIWLRVVLHPELGSEAVGEQLFAEIDGRARELGRTGTQLHASCSAPDDRVAGIYRRAGYRRVRHFVRMVAPLDEPPEEPVFPEGIELRPVDPERDLERIYAADEEAFEDHWGTVRTDFETWRHLSMGADWDPALWFVAWDGDEIAGIALCRPSEGGDPDLGWVDILAVRRPWRRRGLALALLLHSFHALRARGRPRVGLGVDAENLTGAVRLYERAGMAPVQQHDVYEAVI
jgi:mycothiol synthase